MAKNTVKKEEPKPFKVEVNGGRIVTLESFQAHLMMTATENSVKQGNADGVSIMLGLICMIGSIDGVQLTPESLDDIDAVYTGDLFKFFEAKINIEDTDEKGKITGTLPSGKKITAIRPKISHMRNAGRFGDENRSFAQVSDTVEIDGKKIEHLDVRLMDGLDFIAIQTFQGTRAGTKANF